MEVKFKKHVRVILDLNVGDKVTTDEWGPLLDNKVHVIEEIFPHLSGVCGSGFLVKISGYPIPIDSDWLDKV